MATISDLLHHNMQTHTITMQTHTITMPQRTAPMTTEATAEAAAAAVVPSVAHSENPAERNTTLATAAVAMTHMLEDLPLTCAATDWMNVIDCEMLETRETHSTHTSLDITVAMLATTTSVKEAQQNIITLITTRTMLSLTGTARTAAMPLEMTTAHTEPWILAILSIITSSSSNSTDRTRIIPQTHSTLPHITATALLQAATEDTDSPK